MVALGPFLWWYSVSDCILVFVANIWYEPDSKTLVVKSRRDANCLCSWGAKRSSLIILAEDSPFTLEVDHDS